jgi:hypothetical protein
MEAQACELGNETGRVEAGIGEPGELDPGVAQLEPSALGIAHSRGPERAASP